MKLSSLTFLRLLNNYQHKLKLLSLFYKIHKGQLDIDYKSYFKYQYLGDPTNFHMIDGYNKVNYLYLTPILLCLHQLLFLR